MKGEEQMYPLNYNEEIKALRFRLQQTEQFYSQTLKRLRKSRKISQFWCGLALLQACGFIWLLTNRLVNQHSNTVTKEGKKITINRHNPRNKFILRHSNTFISIPVPQPQIDSEISNHSKVSLRIYKNSNNI